MRIRFKNKIKNLDNYDNVKVQKVYFSDDFIVEATRQMASSWRKG